jgi:hypothetical protein
VSRRKGRDISRLYAIYASTCSCLHSALAIMNALLMSPPGYDHSSSTPVFSDVYRAVFGCRAATGHDVSGRSLCVDFSTPTASGRPRGYSGYKCYLAFLRCVGDE